MGIMLQPISANRINMKFNELTENNERALICYVVAGYPDMKTTEDIISSLVTGGADIIELGIPFSDPIADGSTIQEASYKALLKGITPQKCLKISNNIRKKFPNLPIVIMTYSNILQRQGFENFMRRSRQCGIDGFILPDMIIEESYPYVENAAKLGLATIFLASPNTSNTRLQSILRRCTGFIYMVSVYGITGARKSFYGYTFDAIKNIKKTCMISKTTSSSRPPPLAVGFGISTPSHVKSMSDAGADAVVVGSAIIDIIRNSENKKKMLHDLQSFVVKMKRACT